ncbi:PASTA domain-containing protein [Frigidibacter sp. SD6-1]|uniref:PASTA domain-containing protein n=1 Tax=Frigidibacter sp. SD6-1 TaxID=3032581 RepID=UPI0024DFE3E8|nr:PASTA domain-containing protein [Frigidibacter sp. SD6-1]
MPTFQISDAPTRLDMQPPGADGTIPPGKVGFTVRNMGPRAQTGRIRIEPQNGAEPGWFAITGAPDTSPSEVEKEFDFGGNEAVEVTVRPPKGAPAGKYGFQLKVTAEQDPDTDFVVGPTVAFDLAAPPVIDAPKKPFPWWILAVAAVLILVVGGAVTFFVMRGGGGKELALMPDVATQRAEAAAMEVANVGHGVSFATVRESGAAELTVLRTEPKSGKKLAEGSNATLTIQAPNAACSSLVCSFPGAVFPADVITTLVAEGFDVKYAPALSVADGVVALDSARLDQIKNAAPPMPQVNLPDLRGKSVADAVSLLGGLGLGVSYNTVKSGKADGIIQRSDPAGPVRLEQGSTVAIFYNPLPCTGIRCGVIDRIEIIDGPVIWSPFMTKTMKGQFVQP